MEEVKENKIIDVKKEEDSVDDKEPLKNFAYDKDNNIVRVYGKIYGQ